MKVQLKDGRVKEFKNKEDGERYAEITGGKVVKNPIKAKVKNPIKAKVKEAIKAKVKEAIKQFKDRK